MRFILFVGHGSRDETGNEEVRDFVRNLLKKRNYQNTEICFLEFGQPDISTGIDICVKKGAVEIVAVPVILLPAGHSKIHIPRAIDDGRIRHPHVRFYYGTPVGTDIAVLEILRQKMMQALKNQEKEPPLNPAETAILIIGRGSSDAGANSSLFQISRLFWESLQSEDDQSLKFQIVETAFMGVTQPFMTEGLDRCRLLMAKNIIVIPYFLFTGILIERMKKNVADYMRNYPDHRIYLSDYLGFHPLLEDIVARRIEEAVAGKTQLNCDLCKYRIETENHQHHDHNDHLNHHGHHKHVH